MSPAKRFLGITTMSPFFQNEGVERTVANLVERAGATAVGTNTSVAAPAPESPALASAWTPCRAFARMAVHYAWYVSTAAHGRQQNRGGGGDLGLSC